MILTKVSQTHFSNGKDILETKSFLKHDLVHYGVDKALGIFDEADPVTHTQELEQIAGIMHTVYDEKVTNEQILAGAENMFGAYSKPVPPYLNNEFIDTVREQVNELLTRYEFLKTGESLELL